MNAISATRAFPTTLSASSHPGKSVSFFKAVASYLRPYDRELLSMLGRMMFLLLLVTVVIVSVSGQLPFFFLPLGLFLFAVCCMQPKRQHP